MEDLDLKATIGDKRVSTVRLPSIADLLDSFIGANPHIKPYETMVFPLDDWGDLYCDRYDTREEAEAGHKRVCAALADGTLALTEPNASFFGGE